MNTVPRSFHAAPVRVTALALGLCLLAGSGCSSKPHVAKNAPYPAPYVMGIEEITQRDAAQARARELVKAGKTPEDARRIAE